MDYLDVIKDYFEAETYSSGSPFSCRVEDIGDNNYQVYFICSGAEIVYDVFDFREDIDEGDSYYSAIIKLNHVSVDGFEADVNTDYYLDVFRKYQELCEDVESILDDINTYFDDKRTEFM